MVAFDESWGDVFITKSILFYLVFGVFGVLLFLSFKN